MESLHRFLGPPLALQPEYLVLYAQRAGWFMGVRVMCPNHLICLSVSPCVVLSKCLSTASLLSQSQLHQSPVGQHCLYPPPTNEDEGMGFGRLESDSHFHRRDFAQLTHTSDFKIGSPVATLLDAWHYGISAETGQLGVGTLTG